MFDQLDFLFYNTIRNTGQNMVHGGIFIDNQSHYGGAVFIYNDTFKLLDIQLGIGQLNSLLG